MASLKFLLLCLLMATAVTAGPSGGKGLSDQDHYKGGVHHAEYDHEAFLGKAEAQRFHDLPPEEARRRLGIIVDKIDTDRNGKVSDQELAEWVRKVSKRYVYDDVDKTWSYYDTDNDGFVNLDEHKEIFGVVDDPDAIYDHYRGLTYKQKLERDERKFRAVDMNKDGKLNKEEFAGFLHPEAFPELRNVHVDEIMTDMDRNKDNYVTLEEYVEDRWPKRDRPSSGEEPDWIKDDKEQFRTHRDKDHDGRLSREELASWLSPTEYDPAMAEARHLIHQADSDKDGKLSKEEIVNNVDLFAGSQATEWGQFMTRHDEF